MAQVTVKHCDACRRGTKHVNGDCDVCCKRKEAEQERVWQALDDSTKIERLRNEIRELRRLIEKPRC